LVGRTAQCWLQDLSSDLRLDEVLDKTIENALDACPGREFALLLMGEDELRVVRTSGLGPGARRRIADWARGTGETLAEPDETVDLAGHACVRSVPLMFKGRSLGVLVALGTESFGDDDRELLSLFAEQAAVALANAHLFQTLLENATQDSLTGLANRREFERLLARELERSSRYGEIFSLAFIDVDGFKALNDSQGHAAGDVLLRRGADTIQDACRASDVAGRIGGDEFAILLPQTNQFEAAALCERLRAQVEKLADVSLSWGVAEYPTHGVTASGLSRAADAAMYASKPRLVGGERPQGASSGDGPGAGRAR
jgi:diguanylate cyclase (GGDEF)-like protein